ncbi:hypothetical protein EST38_g7213 [Candolleomyces aberdarensis]|uniref:Uncharacterized protein n=1 Tax=Candolleomyces aberdarensis TaxID=2316362 RepID=A0A4Q2DG71_9AGAR|nr:hypothetical protein EST38_g7213 [Candolleomyces aberdarensis]
MTSRRQIQTWCGSVYSRITLTRITTFFFIFSILVSLIQGIIHSFLHSIDYDQKVFLSAITAAGGIPSSNITFLQGSAGKLKLEMCNDIPHGLFGQKIRPCITVFDSALRLNTDLPSVSRTFDWRRGARVVDSEGAVILQSPAASGAVFLTQRCVQTLVEPLQRVTNARREDLAHIFLQLWLLGISVFAIVQDSVPHILTAIVTRVLVAAWSIYAVWRTKYHADAYEEIYTRSGTPCSLDIFSEYFNTRLSIQIADTTTNLVALGIALYLSFELLKTYGSQSFKCVGAPEHVQRINKLFLAFLACLQLEVFILVTGMSMWIDVLLNTAIAKISDHTPEYIACFTTSAVVRYPNYLAISRRLHSLTIISLSTYTASRALDRHGTPPPPLPSLGSMMTKRLPLFLLQGWYAIKRERRKLTVAFLVIAFIIITGWSVMFYSIVYRWTFVEWPYLAVFTVASLTLLLISTVLGIVCRLNFGKGHAEYLQAEAALSSQNFTKEVFTRDDKKEEFDLVEPGKIYYVQTRETDISESPGYISQLPQLSKLDAPFQLSSNRV